MIKVLQYVFQKIVLVYILLIQTNIIKGDSEK